MKRIRYREDFRGRLDEEMEKDGIYFDEKMRRTVIESISSRESGWHREISIPIPVVLLTVMLIVSFTLLGWHQLTTIEDDSYMAHPLSPSQPNHDADQLVQTGSGTFPLSQLQGQDGVQP